MKWIVNIWLKLVIWTEQKRFKAYQSIDFLPTWNFYQVIETGDLRYILKLKDYESLPNIHFSPVQQWNDVLKQYFEESFGMKYWKWISFRKVIYDTKNKIMIIMGAIAVLAIKKDERLIARVRDLAIKFDDSNDDQYAESVLNLVAQLKGYQKYLQIKEREFSLEFKQSDKKVDVSMIVHLIEQFKGFRVDARTLPVRMFLTYQKEYYKLISQRKAKQLYPTHKNAQ